MFRIGLPGALTLFMRKFDDGDPLAVVCIKILVRNVAWYRARQFVHAVGERYIFFAHSFPQARAKYTVTIMIMLLGLLGCA